MSKLGGEPLGNQRLEIARILLRPLVRFFLSHALHFQDFIRVAKVLFLEEAERVLRLQGEKVNISRLSVLTGLQRPDVYKLFREREKPAGDDTKNLLARIIGQWRYNSKFCSRPGYPRVLEFRGDSNEFKALVESITTAINAGTIQFELERLGYAERTAHGLKLIQKTRVFTGDQRGAFEIAARDINDYVRSAHENITVPGPEHNLHFRTEYDNVAIRHMPRIRQWLNQRGKDFHRKAERFLSQFDKDIGNLPPDEPAGGRIAVTSFSAYEIPSPHGDLSESSLTKNSQKNPPQRVSKTRKRKAVRSLVESK